MELASNVARRDTFSRKGPNAFVSHTFEEYARLCEKSIAQYCTWYAYEALALYDHVSNNDWSIGGFHAKKPALYFDFIPFDFDSDTIEKSFESARRFVNYLLERDVPPSHFSIWLSGSKGFHVELDRSVFNVEHPSLDVLRRVKAFAERIQRELNIVIDLSLYSSGRLYRIPNSKHQKTGLHKTFIPEPQFTAEWLAERATWAASAGNVYNAFDHSPVPEPIDLPEPEVEAIEVHLASDQEVDTDLSIISKCPRIRALMANPEGRELRRQAAAVLMEAYGSPDALEVEAFYKALRSSSYMNDVRMEDAEKWRREFEKDGHLKAAKTCTSFGCSKDQKRICGTLTPADHLVTANFATLLTVEEAHNTVDVELDDSFDRPGNPFIIHDMPIGIGKTTTAIRKLAERPAVRTFYTCPTHELASEVFTKMEEAGIESLRWLKSRTSLISSAALDCPYKQAVLIADLNNVGTTRSICTKCPRFPANLDETVNSKCEYFAQFDGMAEARVVIGVHHHINDYIHKKIDLDSRDHLIIDENPFKTFATEIKAVEFEQIAILQGFYQAALEHLLKELESAPLELPDDDGKVAAGGMFGAVRYLMDAEETAQLERIDRADAAALARHHSDVKVFYLTAASIVAGIKLDAAGIEFLLRFKYHRYYAKFLSTIIDLAKYGPALSIEPEFRHIAFPDIIAAALKCAMETGQSYDMNQSYYFPRPMPDKKIIVLDATASRPLYERLVEVSKREPDEEREFVYKKIPLVEQTHASVIQVTNSGYSKTRIGSTEDMFERLMFIPKSLMSTYDSEQVLCVSVMALKDKLKGDLPKSRTSFEHFGDTRGKDRYRDFPIEIIMGGFFVSNEAVVQGLNRLGFHSVSVEMLEAATITVRAKHIARNGDTYFSKRKAFRSVYRGDAYYYANLIYEQASASEIVQATRLRLFSGEKDKRVYIVTNIGLTRMYADRFVTLDELTAELEDESGMKSELDTTKVRRDNLMLAKLNMRQVGDVFTLADVHDDEKTARNFLASFQNSGSVEKVKGSPKTFRKVAPLTDTSRTVTKTNRAEVWAKLDGGLAEMKVGEEFSISDISDYANTTSIRILRDWISEQIKEDRIIAVGEKKGRRYRKVQKITEYLSRLL